MRPASGPLLHWVASLGLRRLRFDENKCPYKAPWLLGGRFALRTESYTHSLFLLPPRPGMVQPGVGMGCGETAAVSSPHLCVQAAFL